LAPGREAFLTPPALFRGERHVAWNDPHHHRDHFPAGRLQRPICGYGYGMGHSGMGIGGVILVVLVVLVLFGEL
jgi:hypothetical protein